MIEVARSQSAWCRRLAASTSRSHFVACSVSAIRSTSFTSCLFSGEFLEIVKKMIFQGKPWDEANREHLIIELGDVIWYAANACMALGISFEDVVARNVTKLEKRYPGGQFDVYYSEHREEGDL